MSDKAKIAILYPQVPGVTGGTELLAEALNERLFSRGYRSYIHTLPYAWEPKELIIQEALAWRQLQLDADVVIPLKFPAYFIAHPNKIVWLQHQYRQVYEFFGSPLSGYSNNLTDGELRETVVALDRMALAEAKMVYANSRNTLSRMEKFNGLEGGVIYPPPVKVLGENPRTFEDFFFAVGRLVEGKGFELLVEAAAKAHKYLKVKIAGTGPLMEPLKKMIAEYHLENQVELLGYLSNEEVKRLYASCAAVHFSPVDEDYGLIAVEAMKQGKGVITSSNSGGPTELVVHESNGYVLPPDASEHAVILDKLWSDRKLCRNLGDQAREDAKKISWQVVIDELEKWLK